MKKLYRKAIIADDEPAVGNIIHFFINKYNIPIEIVGEAYSGSQAIDMIMLKKPDVVFLDIQMPVCNGLSVIETILRKNIYGVSFIIITAYGYFEYAQEALRLGVKDILLKPLKEESFLESIKRVTGFNVTGNCLMNEVLNYISLHYAENISLDVLAKQFYTNRYHLCRLFKRYANSSFTDYLNCYRINIAKTLLLETTLSIKQISDDVGYQNINNFYKHFKKNLYVTPKEFRQAQINECELKEIIL